MASLTLRPFCVDIALPCVFTWVREGRPGEGLVAGCFFDSVAARLFCDLLHSAAVFARGSDRYGFCGGSCRSLCGGVKVALFHSTAVLLYIFGGSAFAWDGACR